MSEGRVINRQSILNRRPEATVRVENFRFVGGEVPRIDDGDIPLFHDADEIPAGLHIADPRMVVAD